MITVMQMVLTITPCFPMQAYAKLTALFEQRMDSYANADARVSLESRFPVIFNNNIYVIPDFLPVLYTTNKPTKCN
jgi:hypothetical protein